MADHDLGARNYRELLEIGLAMGVKPAMEFLGFVEDINTIEDALERMEVSRALTQYLGKKFITGYVATKRAEHENFKRVISSWEREFLLFAV